jgi:hypothetical protein
MLHKTNTSEIPSDIPFLNISDLAPPLNMIFLPSNLNFPCGLGTINLDNGRELSKKDYQINNNNTF